jgi:hypothetical protein
MILNELLQADQLVRPNIGQVFPNLTIQTHDIPRLRTVGLPGDL